MITKKLRGRKNVARMISIIFAVHTDMTPLLNEAFRLFAGFVLAYSIYIKFVNCFK